MKVGPKTRTLRGQITASGGKAQKNIIIDDLRINHGLIIRDFVMWPQSLTATSESVCNGILSYSALGNAAELQDASDNTQFAWYTFAQYQDTSMPPASVPVPLTSYGFIDPNHIVNRDMFVSLRGSSDFAFNYMIICEEVELTDNEAIITILKENSQG